FKYALLVDECRVLTFQLRTYAPTGDGDRGLGTDHATLEPALLLYQRLGDRLIFEGEFRDWIPVRGSDFAGNVIRYGGGFSYLALDGERFHVSPVAELVGWTFLSGKESAFPARPRRAAGDSILNAKVGLRFAWDDQSPGLLRGSDFAISYGRALTGEFIYKDILRVELRFRF